MPSTGPFRAPDNSRSFLLLHGLAIPLLLMGAALWLPYAGWDARLSALFYDGNTQHFLVGGDGWVELLGHRLGKSIVTAFWLLILAAALAAGWIPGLAKYRRVLWTTALAMGLGPAVVTGLKDINSHVCPWSLQQFGGAAAFSAEWFVPRIEAGRCFPGGHASSGFSLIALAFAGRSLNWPALERAGLATALITGGLFSAVRVMQGAHFMSHNLWAAAIDWWVAAAVFLPLLLARPSDDSTASKLPAARHEGSA